MTVLSAMPCWFYDKLSLRRTPSIIAGINPLQESRYRKEGARFIINVGTNMGLRYDTMATGVVYFHRFYMFHTFKTFPRYITACCCLFLAGKVEETPKKCKDVIKAAKALLTETQFMQFGDDPKEEIMTLERILLQTIKFDLQVEHPYCHLLKYAKCLKGDKKMLEKLVQMAWTFINDSLCTTLCLQWEPEVIAIALMYLAGKLSKFVVTDWNDKTSKHKYWWDMYVQDLTIDVLEDICHQVLDLYSTPAANPVPESPPSTPPSKSNIRKVAKPSSIPTTTTQTSSPVVAKPKPKEVPVGQPIPRLEPGELKRKVAKTPLKKDVVDAKIPRLSNSTPQASTSTSSSPKKLASNQEKSESSEAKKPMVGHSIPTIETAYHTGLVSSSKAPVTKAEPIKTIITNATEPILKPEKMSTHKSSYVSSEAVDTFYPDNQASSTSYSQPSTYVTQPVPLGPDAVITPLSQPSYDDMYRPPVIPHTQPPLPPPQAQYPPLPPTTIHPIPPYAAPPPPLPQSMPNMPLPPPMSQLPPPIPTTSNIRNDHVHAAVPRPPPSMPPNLMSHQNVGGHAPLQSQNVPVRPPPMSHQNIGPRLPLPRPPFRPRTGSNPDSYGFDHQLQGEPRPRMPHVRGPCPPRFMQEGPPHQDYSHFDHERSMPPYHPDAEYDSVDAEYDRPYVEYDEYGAGMGKPNHPYEYDNMRRRFGNMEPRMPRNHERMPRPNMMGNRPRMESPTGIPPVRITGSR